ncbi:hypothetical protein D5086_008050 [Populus alba]|uniref:Uncharacterized protein n=1 Tax=Populus alba TaxID=43335 RepID=A0ACC4CEY3_POPAL
MKNNNKHQLALLLFPIILFCQPISAIDFVFNGFNSSSVSLYGSAVFESRILTLTNQTSFTIGRALYPKKIPTKAQNSSFVYPFSTSFIFAMAPYKNVLPGHGLVFLFVPFTGIEDVNSLTSIAAADAGYWADNSRSSSSNGNSSDDDRKSFKEQKLNNGKNYQVWIDYADSLINVTMAPAGQLVQSHKILAWSFSNSNFSLSERLVTTGLPSFVLPKDPFFRSKGFISGATVGGLLLVVSAATIFWRPIEEGKPPLVEWLWKMMMEGKLLHALDERLRARGDQFDEEEVERILHLGLLCAYPDPKVRPTMRQAVKVLEGKNELNEIEIEDMDTYLLKQMKSKDWWTDYSQSSNHGSHPTFDEIRRYQSSSMSLSWANTTMEGRASLEGAESEGGRTQIQEHLN